MKRFLKVAEDFLAIVGFIGTVIFIIFAFLPDEKDFKEEEEDEDYDLFIDPDLDKENYYPIYSEKKSEDEEEEEDEEDDRK